MRDYELQEKLRPSLAVELPRPGGQRLAAHRRKQPSTVEGSVDNHGSSALRGEWQQPLFDAPIGEVVRELHEVETLALERSFQLVVLRALRGRDADVAHGARGLQRLQRRKMCFPVGQLVDVDEI